MLLVSLYCLLLITTSVFSDVYLDMLKISCKCEYSAIRPNNDHLPLREKVHSENSLRQNIINSLKHYKYIHWQHSLKW